MTEPLITQINTPPGLIDLGIGNPDLDLLPVDLIQQSAEIHFASGEVRSLQYGKEQGDGYFRRDMANFLTDRYRNQVDPEVLFITTGASSALDLICTLYTRPGDTIFVEVPTYFLALRIFADHGLQAIPIPMDGDGLILDVLDEFLADFQPKFIYTIPTFQNPSGLTLSQTRREKLVETAQTHNFLVVADEVYHFLPYTKTPPQPFAHFSGRAEQIISINSFSKILAPGLRLGWIQAHKSVVGRLAGCGLLDSGGGMNPFTSALVRGLVASGGLDENITDLCREYSQRLKALDLALKKYLPMAEYTLPEGGFFFWVRLPGVDMAELRRKAPGFKVDLRQGALFSAQEGLQDYMRLSFCFYDSSALVEAVRRLKDCLES